MKYVKVIMYNEYSVFEVIEEYADTIQCKLKNCENGYMIISKKDMVKSRILLQKMN